MAKTVLKNDAMAAAWHELPFKNISQEQGNWCWAAVASSVAEFYNPKTIVPQCSIANAECQRSDCCTIAGVSACDVYQFLGSSLMFVRHLDRWIPTGPVQLDEVRQEIDGSRPLCMRTEYFLGGAHFLTIVGYLPDDRPAVCSGYLIVEDSLFGRAIVRYAKLVKGHLGGRWTDTYFTRA